MKTDPNERLYETLRATLPALVRLGDFVGNIDNGGASGMGKIDRCALIARVKSVLPEYNQKEVTE